jgi:hypothetical protein
MPAHAWMDDQGEQSAGQRPQAGTESLVQEASTALLVGGWLQRWYRTGCGLTFLPQRI